MLKVIYEDSGEYPPYIDFKDAEIVLTYDGELFARGTNGSISVNVYNGIDDAWSINTAFKGDFINELLDQIKPYAEKLHKQMGVENGSGTYKNNDVAYKLNDTIADIIRVENYHADETNSVKYMDVYDYVSYMNEPVPSESIAYYYTNDNSLDIGILFTESTLQEAIDHAYDCLFEYFEDADDYAEAIQDIYNAYKNDHYKNEFFTKFLPKLSSMYDDIVSYENDELYIDDEPVDIEL